MDTAYCDATIKAISAKCDHANAIVSVFDIQTRAQGGKGGYFENTCVIVPNASKLAQAGAEIKLDGFEAKTENRTDPLSKPRRVPQAPTAARRV